MMRKKANVNESVTLIGPGIKLESAKLTGSESVKIEGTFYGNIDLDGVLTIAESGCVVGNIRAKQIEIAGRVKGTLNCDATIHLTSTANVDGRIDTHTLRTDDGSVFNGRCRMKSGLAENVEDAQETAESQAEEESVVFDFSKLSDALIPESGPPNLEAQDTLASANGM